MPSLFITVGSTLFPALTDLALSPTFLELLASHGVTEVTVQYGSADITVPPSGQNGRMNGKGEGSFVFRPDAGSVAGTHPGAEPLAQGDGLRIRFMRYTSQFDAEVAGADMVISHAGMYPSCPRLLACIQRSRTVIELTNRLRLYTICTARSQTAPGHPEQLAHGQPPIRTRQCARERGVYGCFLRPVSHEPVSDPIGSGCNGCSGQMFRMVQGRGQTTEQF